MQDYEFVALDCETSGLHFIDNCIIELGAVKFSLFATIAKFSELFHPSAPPSKIVEKLTGITKADLLHAPKFAEKKAEFEKFCQNTILLGHNLQFDLNFLKSADCDLSTQPHFDTFQLAKLLLTREHQSLALDRLASNFGIKLHSAHRALPDAETTRTLFLILVAQAQKFSLAKWQQIQHLQCSNTNSTQCFAQLICSLAKNLQPLKLVLSKLQDEPKNLPVAPNKNPAKKFLMKHLFSPHNQILETTYDPNKIPAELVFSPQAPLNKPHLFAPSHYFCAQRFTQFQQKKLTPLELTFAAKLILHERPAPEIFFDRLEKLLFGQVMTDANCLAKHPDCGFNQAKKILKTKQKIFSNHSSFAFFANNSQKKLVHNALDFLNNQEQEQSLILELPFLINLLPKAENKLTLFWGLLGILFQKTAPPYGILDFAKIANNPDLMRVKKAAQNFLDNFTQELPLNFQTAFQKIACLDSETRIELRVKNNREIYLKLKPHYLKVPPARNTIFTDLALSLKTTNNISDQNDFTFSRKLLGLTAATPVQAEPLQTKLPNLIVIKNLPKVTSDNFNSAVTRLLLALIRESPVNLGIAFPNRLELGVFFEKACNQLNRPIFAKKIPAQLPPNFIFLNTTFSQIWPAQITNFVLIKIPFQVQPGADFTTETLPYACLRLKKIWRQKITAQKFFLLDPRLTTQSYGKQILANLEAEPEYREIFHHESLTTNH